MMLIAFARIYILNFEKFRLWKNFGWILIWQIINCGKFQILEKFESFWIFENCFGKFSKSTKKFLKLHDLYLSIILFCSKLQKLPEMYQIAKCRKIIDNSGQFVASLGVTIGWWWSQNGYIHISSCNVISIWMRYKCKYKFKNIYCYFWLHYTEYFFWNISLIL